MKPTQVDVKELIAQGYRRVSRKFGMLSRIDRPDWMEYMAAQHSPWNPEEGMAWAKLLLKTGHAEDQYRRVYSKDQIEISPRLALQVPCSSSSLTGYLPKKEGA